MKSKYTILMSIILTASIAFSLGYIQGLREWHQSLTMAETASFWRLFFGV